MGILILKIMSNSAIKENSMLKIAFASQENCPGLYANLDRLLAQRQRVARDILNTDNGDTEEDKAHRVEIFEAVQDLIKKYLGL